jgi:predicted transcriptional regulator
MSDEGEGEDEGRFQLAGRFISYSSGIDDVGYLARSKHRMHVLHLLAERPHTREELSKATGVTRVTLSRILSGLTERSWITRHEGDGFRITDLGANVYENLARLIGTAEVSREKAQLIQRLPTEWLGFDIHELVDSEVIVGDDADPMAAARVVATEIGEATTVRALVGSVTLLPMQNSVEAVRRGTTLDNQIVYDQEATTVCLQNPDIADWWQELESSTPETIFYSHNQTFPCNVDLIDDSQVYLTVSGVDSGNFGVIKSANPTIVEWAHTIFHDRFSEATTLTERYEASTEDQNG